MKRLRVAATITFCGLGLAACSQPSSQPPPSNLTIVQIATAGMDRINGAIVNTSGSDITLSVDEGDCLVARYATVITKADTITVTILGDKPGTGACSAIALVRKVHLILPVDPIGKKVSIAEP